MNCGTGFRFAPIAWRNHKGQMVVELSFLFPALIIVAVVAVNALSFAGECARFDREFRIAVLAECTTPSLTSASQITLETLENETFNWFSADEGELVRYTGTLTWYPTLFGMGLKNSVFGVSVFELHHECSLTVNPHQSGDIL